MKHLGFTGTRRGLTDEQKDTIKDFLLNHYEFNIYHHGDCVGADAEFHELIKEWLWAAATVIIHPPTEKTWRAYCEDPASPPSNVEIREPKPFLDRDLDIVLESAYLLAAPETFHERKRSGTWTTIRYATNRTRPVTIVCPDGSTREER